MVFKIRSVSPYSQVDHNKLLIRRLAKMCYYAYAFSIWEEAIALIASLWRFATLESKDYLAKHFEVIMNFHYQGYHKEASKTYRSIYKTILCAYK